MVLNPAALLRDKNKFGIRAQVYSWVLFFLRIIMAGAIKVVLAMEEKL